LGQREVTEPDPSGLLTKRPRPPSNGGRGTARCRWSNPERDDNVKTELALDLVMWGLTAGWVLTGLALAAKTFDCSNRLQPKRLASLDSTKFSP
jgi:hypothetical protein